MKSIIKIIISIIILVTICSACKKTVDPQPDNSVASGPLYFHLHTIVDDTIEIGSYNTIYGDTSIGQRRISVSKAQLYISNIQLEKSDGTLLSIPDTIVLKDLDTEIYSITNAPAGQYKSVRFYVGLSENINSKVPDSSTPAVLKDTTMWFSKTLSSDNYVFVNFQGSIDTTSSAKGKDTDMALFVYKLGTNVSYKQVIMPTQMFSVVPDQVQYIHISVDYTKLFNGVTLSDHNNLMITSTSDNTLTIAGTVANNIPAMFSYEE